MKNKILFRTDSGKNIGIGHLIRSIALAQKMREKGFAVKFLTVSPEKKWLELLKGEGFQVDMMSLNDDEKGKKEDIKAICREIDGFEPDWTVLDNYYYDYEYQSAVKRKEVKLLCIDDIAETATCADILLNHGIQAEKLRYKTEKYTKKLLGPGYALIRKDLIKDKSHYVNIKEKKNVLVTLGGGSQQENMRKILEGLLEVKECNVRVMIDTEDPAYSLIREMIAVSPDIKACGFSPDMRGQYRWADLAVCAGGGTCWELCFYGIVGIVGILSDNQAVIASELDKKGIFVSAGWYKDLEARTIALYFKKLLADNDKIEDMRTKAIDLVDGNGSERVFAEMCRE